MLVESCVSEEGFLVSLRKAGYVTLMKAAARVGDPGDVDGFRP